MPDLEWKASAVADLMAIVDYIPLPYRGELDGSCDTAIEELSGINHS